MFEPRANAVKIAPGPGTGTASAGPMNCSMPERRKLRRLVKYAARSPALGAILPHKVRRLVRFSLLSTAAGYVKVEAQQAGRQRLIKARCARLSFRERAERLEGAARPAAVERDRQR